MKKIKVVVGLIALVFVLTTILSPVCSKTVMAKSFKIKQVKQGETRERDVLYYRILKNGTVSIASFSSVSAHKLEIPSKIKGKKVTKIESSVGSLTLRSIKIPASVTKIEDETFSHCLSLRSITVASKNKKYSSKDGVLFNKSKTKLLRYPTGKKDKEYTVPKSVKKIGAEAFWGSMPKRNLIIPKNVKSIGDNALGAACYGGSVTILNKKVKLDDSGLAFGSWSTDWPIIYGYKNSTAQKYSKRLFKEYKAQ